MTGSGGGGEQCYAEHLSAEGKLNEKRERCIKKRGHDGVVHRDKYNGTWSDVLSGEPICRAEHQVPDGTGADLPAFRLHEDTSGNKRGTKEAVDHPDHYNMGEIEVIDVIEDWKLGFHEGNAVKYIGRAKFKGKELEDLEKARWYLDRRIEQLVATR